ncbi:hypothetical protein R83H12_01965 [Fibrobacteria bacterium R8-3-H12]
MERIVSMTAEEIRKTYGKDEAAIMAMAKAAPEFKGNPFPNSKPLPIKRGFAAFKEYIKQKEQQKAEKPKDAISFQVAPDLLKKLRATGRGWQTRVRNYLMEGLKKGKLAAPANRVAR